MTFSRWDLCVRACAYACACVCVCACVCLHWCVVRVRIGVVCVVRVCVRMYMCVFSVLRRGHDGATHRHAQLTRTTQTRTHPQVGTVMRTVETVASAVLTPEPTLTPRHGDNSNDVMNEYGVISSLSDSIFDTADHPYPEKVCVFVCVCWCVCMRACVCECACMPWACAGVSLTHNNTSTQPPFRTDLDRI